MSSASPALALRPGILRGAYPEREDVRPTLLPRMVRGALGLLSVPRAARRSEIAAFARSVDDAAAGLESVDAAGFDSAVADLRRAL